MQIEAGMSAVVTGGASGVGRSISLALAGRGVNVAVADIDAEAAASTAGEVAALGVQALPYQIDVSELSAMQGLAEASWSRFSDVDILINNAGVTLRPFRATWNTSIDDYRWVMNINWWGVLYGHHVFVPRLLERGRSAHIVNTSSMATLTTIAGHSAYSAAKAAVDAFTLCARAELERAAIGVSLLHPARVQTRISSSERLRPEAERSETRRVQPWLDELHPASRSAVVASGLAGDESLPDTATEPLQAISPRRVGDMVLRGIELNLPRILTHPAPEDQLRARYDEVLQGVGVLHR
jgi:NAD(P)-dependent dehydrogenase (short-subunit alcohol dehydrogenase family)